MALIFGPSHANSDNHCIVNCKWVLYWTAVIAFKLVYLKLAYKSIPSFNSLDSPWNLLLFYRIQNMERNIAKVIAHTKSLSHQKRKKQIGSHIGCPQKILFCFVSSVRSSNSHPDLLVIQQHHHPTFSDHTGPQHWTFTFWATTAI